MSNSKVVIQIELKNDNTMNYQSTSMNNVTNMGLLEMAKHLIMLQAKKPNEKSRIVVPEANGWSPEHPEAR